VSPVWQFDADCHDFINPRAARCRRRRTHPGYPIDLNGLYKQPPASRLDGTGIACSEASKRNQERIMKLNFGQTQLVLALSSSPFDWFYGHTERMSLTSLSLLFVQFSLFARQPSV
jgi:hypothetical protein